MDTLPFKASIFINSPEKDIVLQQNISINEQINFILPHYKT